MPVNREYKDTVFTLVFRDPEAVLSLYNAVNGTMYDSLEGLQVNTLEDADGCRSGIFSRMRNDLSFIFAEQLNVYEHQSTVNPNMPLRMLFYVSSLLRRLISTKELYYSRAVTIQEPVFVVLYNGEDVRPEQEWMTLSSLYSGKRGEPRGEGAVPEEGAVPAEIVVPAEQAARAEGGTPAEGVTPADQAVRAGHVPALELAVRMININSGHNPGIISRCKALEGYVEFVRRSRSALDGARGSFARQSAMNRVIDSCIRDGFLAEFLSVPENREAIIMAEIWEYDEEAARRAAEEDLQAAREQAKREGYDKGYDQGERAGYDKGERAGYDKGERAGYDKGERAGYDKGEKAGYNQGFESGRESGEARLSALIGRLMKEQRLEDVAAAVNNPVRREELYKEFPDIE